MNDPGSSFVTSQTSPRAHPSTKDMPGGRGRIDEKAFRLGEPEGPKFRAAVLKRGQSLVTNKKDWPKDKAKHQTRQKEALFDGKDIKPNSR